MIEKIEMAVNGLLIVADLILIILILKKGKKKDE